jgi:FtsZ-binding cell division protein ZapB
MTEDLDKGIGRLNTEIGRLTAWNQQQAQEACDYMARIQKLTAEVDRLRARESALLEANNLELERRRQAERERDNMRATWERAWAQPTSAEYQERIRGLLGTIGRFAAYRTAAEAYILRLRQIVYAGLDTIRAQAGIEITSLDLAGKLEAARAELNPARKHQPFEYDVEPEATQCH